MRSARTQRDSEIPKFRKGERNGYQVTVEDDAGAIIDLVAATVTAISMKVYKDTALATLLFTKTGTVVGAAPGKLDFTIEPSDTSTLEGDKSYIMIVSADINGDTQKPIRDLFTLEEA